MYLIDCENKVEEHLDSMIQDLRSIETFSGFGLVGVNGPTLPNILSLPTRVSVCLGFNIRKENTSSMLSPRLEHTLI